MKYQETIRSLWEKCSHSHIVRLRNIENLYHLDGELFAKVENKNLTGSIKDKTALQMVDDADQQGLINEETIFIEATSGNTGISLAFIAHSLGLRCLIVMPISVSKERRNIIQKYGADLSLVDGGMQECEDKVLSLLKENHHYLRLSQFNNLANPKAHYRLTGPEINCQLPNLDYIVSGIGTGGTISGIGQYYKEHKLSTKIVGVEPSESPLLTKGMAGHHLIQGIGANFIPSTLNLNVVDEIHCCPSQEAINMFKLLKKETDLSVGISSGASLYVAIQLLKEHPKTSALAIFPDNGDRYYGIK